MSAATQVEANRVLFDFIVDNRGLVDCRRVREATGLTLVQLHKGLKVLGAQRLVYFPDTQGWWSR